MGGLSSGRKPMMAGFVSADIFSPLSYEDIKKESRYKRLSKSQNRNRHSKETVWEQMFASNFFRHIEPNFTPIF
jgi:hypothetical protein